MAEAKPGGVPMITHVYVFDNGMVMTFDQHGRQMPDYQGKAEEVLDAIKAVFPGPIEYGAYRYEPKGTARG